MEYHTEGEGSAYAQLQELSGSDYEIRDGEPDIRGWEVKDENGNILGEVHELLFDPKVMKVRYIILDSEADNRKVLIPIGLAQLRTENDDVVLPGINALQLNQLNEYKGWEEMTAEVESTDFIIFDPEYTHPYSYPGFYDHSHFDEDRFYARGKDTAGNSRLQEQDGPIK